MNSTNSKSVLLYKVNTRNAKALTESVIMTTLLARCLLLAVSELFSVLPPNSTCLLLCRHFSGLCTRLLSGYGHNGNVYFSSPPGYEEDSRNIYRRIKPLYGMPSAARAWHTTMGAFLKREGCETVGFGKSMW